MARRPPILEGALLCACAFASAGCYSYVAVPTEGLVPGEDVRAVIRPENRSELQEFTNGDGASIEGELLARSDQELLVYVPVATRTVGFHSEELSQRVRIDEAAVLVVERRELDRGRTAVLVGGLGLGTALIIAKAISGNAGGNTVTPPGGQPSQSVLPGFPLGVRIPLGIP